MIEFDYDQQADSQQDKTVQELLHLDSCISQIQDFFLKLFIHMIFLAIFIFIANIPFVNVFKQLKSNNFNEYFFTITFPIIMIVFTLYFLVLKKFPQINYFNMVDKLQADIKSKHSIVKNDAIITYKNAINIQNTDIKKEGKELKEFIGKLPRSSKLWKIHSIETVREKTKALNNKLNNIKV